MKIGATVRCAKIVSVLGPVLAVVLAYILSSSFREGVGDTLVLLRQEDLSGVRTLILSFGPWSPVVSVGLMVLQAVASPIPAFAINIANGLAFGAVWGTVIGLAGRVLAAVVCFYLARTLGRGVVESMVGARAIARSDRWFERWGTQTVLLSRLVPFFSFDLVSYAAGLTRIRLPQFLLATAVGELPAVALYSWFAGRAPEKIWMLLFVNAAIFAAVLAIGLFIRHRSPDPDISL